LNRSRVGVIAAAVVAVLAATTVTAWAWPAPSTSSTGGVCQPDGTRSEVEVIVVDLETEFPDAPASVVDVTVSAPFKVAAPVFTPAELPNTGQASASATLAVPPGVEGDVTVDYVMVWTGPEGVEDSRPGSVTVHVVPCPQPAPTTTTTTVPSTTTTTVAPSTSSSSTTSTAPPSTVRVEAESVVAPAAAAPAVPVEAAPAFTG
jgi:hypothetical protein